MAPELSRYSRQMRVRGIGTAGQERLAASTVLVVGCGALGTHLCESLVRAGVGTLHVVDRDLVERSNLQRQTLFTEAHADGEVPKATAAAEALAAINREVRVLAHVAHCSREFLDALPAPLHLVLDGTDNFPTRYLLNDWCASRQIPWIYGGAVGSEGAAMVIRPGGPCLRCLWPEPPQGADVGNCETAGILAPAIAAVTAFQAAEALKLLLGVPPTAGVFTCDVWRGQYAVQTLHQPLSAGCPACAGTAFPALSELGPMLLTMCGRDAVQVDPGRGVAVDLAQLQTRLQGSVNDLQRTAHLLAFAADGCRFRVFPDGRTLLFGCSDALRARALFDRYVGVHR